jgi:hypothetical protein
MPKNKQVVFCSMRAYALKHCGSIVKRMGHYRHGRLFPFYKLAIKPDVLRALVLHREQKLFAEYKYLRGYMKPCEGNFMPINFRVLSGDEANFFTTAQLSSIT